jgi:hypothetical protein
MTTPNPPPPFDADAARRLASLTDFEQSHLWCNCEDFDPPERCGSCQAWDRIKADIRAAVAEVERLRCHLPQGMEHCTIRFKECDKGHGRLVADNWVDHGCHVCERDQLRERVRELERDLSCASYDLNY